MCVTTLSMTLCISRSTKANVAVGGAKHSQHLTCNGADIQVQGYTPEEVYGILDDLYPLSHGIGLYRAHVHLDARPDAARWRMA